MPRTLDVEGALAEAEALEKGYDWVKAAGLYEQALHAVEKEDFLKKGEIRERIGYCLCRAAFQAETQDEFRRRMRASVEAYEDAAELFERLENSEKHARIDCCRAMASHNRSFLVESVSEKKALLDECWKLEQAALKVYEETGDKLRYGKTCNDLLSCLYDRLLLVEDWKERKSILEEAMEYGERAVEALSEVRDEYELAQAYYLLSLHFHQALPSSRSMENRKEVGQKCLTYAKKALDVSEKTGDSYLIGMSNFAICRSITDFRGDYDSSLRYAARTLEMGQMTKDNLMMARGYTGLAWSGYWKSRIEEDPDKRRKGFYEVIQHAEDAINRLQLVSYPVPLYVYIPHVDGYSYLAFHETSLKEKRALLEKAVEVGRKDLEQAKSLRLHTGETSLLVHCFGKALMELSTTETKTSEKRRMLEEASKYREECIKLHERMYRSFFWLRAVSYYHSALIKAELAEIETNDQKKEELLTRALADMEVGLRMCGMEFKAAPPDTWRTQALGRFQYSFGKILNKLYSLTGEKTFLEKAIKGYGDAIQTWEKDELQSWVAETHWQIAKLHDHLGQHSEAAREFKSASERYRLAAEKMPQFKEFYTDYGIYMQAWNELEKAKHHHADKRYGRARERYEYAARLFGSTKRWNYLSPNCLAWARLEEAEDLSRGERIEEARNLFQKAVELFLEAREFIMARLEEIDVRDEKEMATQIVNASDIRREYCLGRIALEEAKTLDRKGKHASSSGKYGSAAERFQRVADALENESDRKELRPIVYLCQAWQTMTKAEAEGSPELYSEASNLFEEAREHTLDEKARVLALGHSYFCKALRAGIRFQATGDVEIYSAAKKHLNAALNYYLKAGFKNASEYAKATQRLFDAYMYLTKAEIEVDASDKARYYQMASRLLRASADSYLKARHPEKSEEVRRLLESVRDKQELAISLTQVLHAPTITSSTTSFSTPTPTYEKPAGLGRFEHADIQAHLTVSEEVTMEDEVDVRLDLVNVARNFGLLVRVDDLVLPGFKVIVSPPQYKIENGSIDMKGRRLEPLRVESIRLRLQARKVGVVSLSPQVMYVDDVGEFRTCRPEQATITVHPRLPFEFKTKTAQSIFDFLVVSFAEDYMKRKIVLEKSGWRTLMEIIKHCRISKYSVYGDGVRRGPAISELEGRGLVETRIFLGERGRGGRILKTRISYENETVKQYIDQRIMKNPENSAKHIVK